MPPILDDLEDLARQAGEVLRAGFKREKRVFHKSEIDLDDWTFDVEIINDGTIEELYSKVEKIYRERKSLYE